MSKIQTKQEILSVAKPMVVNLQVAKTILNKSQTRRVVNYNLTEKMLFDEFALKCEFFKNDGTVNYGCTNKNCTEISKDGNGKNIGKCFTWSCPHELFIDYDDKKGQFNGDLDVYIVKRKWKIGDIIWVREPARVSIMNDINSGELMFEYLADDDLDITDKKYKVNLHKIKTPKRFVKGGKVTAKWIRNCQGVPNGCIKEMARTFLKITDVRPERLQDITYEDIMAEGCDVDISDCITYDGEDQEKAVRRSVYSWYRDLWDSTAKNGYKWEDNPYVFVYEFDDIEVEE